MLIGDASKYFEMCIIREFIFIYGTCDVCDMASVCVCRCLCICDEYNKYLMLLCRYPITYFTLCLYARYTYSHTHTYVNRLGGSRFFSFYLVLLFLSISLCLYCSLAVFVLFSSVKCDAFVYCFHAIQQLTITNCKERIIFLLSLYHDTQRKRGLFCV